MRIRRIDDTGDMVFGSSQQDYWHDEPDGVALHVLDRLMLWTGQWFYDLSSGTPWQTEVLGERTQWTRDIVVQSRVRQTPHVTEIVQYASYTDVNQREWQAAMIINTEYGAVALRAGRLPGTVPDLPVPPGRGQAPALLLGIEGGTPLTATPANLAAGPGQVDVADFTIQRLNPGSYG
jgi:hypothetical protein